MLVQEEADKVILLPACPDDWTEGELTGVRLKGNASLSFRWENGRVTQMTVTRMGGTSADAYHRDFIVNGNVVKVEPDGDSNPAVYRF